MRVALASALALAVALGCLAASAPAHPSGPELCLQVLDVGQGDALLLELPEGQHWLVDGGGVSGGAYGVGRWKLLPALRRSGVDRLERIVITHGHADHFEGLFAVVEELAVEGVWIPTRGKATPRFLALLSSIERRGIPLHIIDEGADWPAAPAPARARVLHPWPRWREGAQGDAVDTNNGSVVLRLQLGDVSFLLMGDLEVEGEARLLAAERVEPATVLKAGHHASRTSSSAALLDAARPLVAMTGIGEDNSYGFPHALVTQRLLLRDVPLYWTARHGALRACTRGFALRVQQSDEHDRWQPLRSWDVQALADWREAANQAPHPDPAALVEELRGPQPTCRRPPKRRARKKRRAKRRRVPVVKEKAAPAPEAAPTPPLLEVDRGWRKKRKRRRRLKAPWR